MQLAAGTEAAVYSLVPLQTAYGQAAAGQPVHIRH